MKAPKRKPVKRRKPVGKSPPAGPQVPDLMRTCPIPVLMLDPSSSSIVDANPAAVEKYGYSRAEFTRMRLDDLSFDKQAGKRAKRLAVNGGGTGPLAWRHKTKKGRLIEVEALMHELTHKGRAAVAAMIQDITERKRLESTLKGALTHLQSVVVNVPMVLFAVDRSGIFTLSEGRGLESLELAAGEVIGRSVFDVYAHNQHILSNIERAFGGESFTATVKEAGRYFETRYVPQRGLDGSVEGVLGVAVDITRREAAEREREHLVERERSALAVAETANRAKDEFLAVLSHELRTPLTAMMGWTYLLREQKCKGKEHSRALDAIERNMKLQSQVIEDLLDVSRVVTGNLKLDMRPVDLVEIVRAAIDVAHPAAQARQIRLFIDHPRTGVSVIGDRERLKQIVWNLLSNAVKFTAAGGRVSLRLRRDRRSVWITVRDNGQGIPPEVVPHVFERFLQGEKSLTREHGGLGLGLSIVRHLVEMHGGTVRAASEGHGKGSEFQVQLPLEGSTPVEASPAQHRLEDATSSFEQIHALSGSHVLVVDDETDELETIASILEKCGAEVRPATSVSEALEILHAWRPDAMVADIAMPGEDGLSLIRRVRALAPAHGGSVPAAALISRARVEDRTEVLLAGYQIYLPKPVDAGELATVVSTLVRGRRRRRRRRKH